MEELEKEIKAMRRKVDKNKYKELKKKNKNDLMYGWAFAQDGVLQDGLKSLKAEYDKQYYKEILLVYHEILYACRKEV